MKTANWYPRLLLTACTLLLLVIAAELHIANRFQASGLSAAQLTTAPRSEAAFAPVAASFRQPLENAQSTEMRVRIIGYEFNNARFDLGNQYSTQRSGIPVATHK